MARRSRRAEEKRVRDHVKALRAAAPEEFEAFVAATETHSRTQAQAENAALALDKAATAERYDKWKAAKTAAKRAKEQADAAWRTLMEVKRKRDEGRAAWLTLKKGLLRS